MAISTVAFSPKQFKIAIAEQDEFGNIQGAGTYHTLDVDSVGSPSLNPVQSLDVKTGSRVLQQADFFQSVTTSVKEISISGTATTNALDLLLENIIGEAEGSASGVYNFASNAGTQSVGTGATSQAGTLLSVIIISPHTGTENSNLAFKDCVVTNLTLNGDMGTEGGRIKFSATLQTGSVVDDLTDAATAIATAYTGTENYVMTDWSDPVYRQLVGVNELVMNSFSLTLDNPASFVGGTSAGYEVVVRAGEFSATLDASVKYDDKTENMFEVFNNQTSGSDTGTTLLNNDDTLSDGTFGIHMPESVLTNVSFNEGDIMMLDLSIKAVGTAVNSSTSLVVVSC